MRFNRSNLTASLAVATSFSFLAQPALADTGGGLGFRGEAFGGIARDERPLGNRKDDFSGGVLPSLTLGTNGPIALQIDGMAASHIGDTVLAGGAHAGFKATESLSVGLYGAYANFDSVIGLDTWRIGGEAVYHGSSFSLSAVAGYEDTQRATVVAGPINGFTAVDSYGRDGSFFSMADVTFYADENWSLTAGHRYVGRRHAAALGTEKGFAGSGLSLFAEGRIGDAGYTAAWAGIRIKLGGDRSSLQANDQSGFTNRLKDELFAQTNTRQRTLVAPPPPPPPPSGGEGGCCGACYAQ